MFIHNLKYTIQTLFKNKILIFWTFAFPIILGIFFNMAFSNIENDEQLKVFDIAVVNDSHFEKQIIYKETLKELSDKDSKNQLFNIKYVTKKKADSLLDDSEIEGYIQFKNNEPNVVVKENGTYETLLKFVVTEVKQNKSVIEELCKKNIETQIAKGNTSFDGEKIAKENLLKINDTHVKLMDKSSANLGYMQIEFYTLLSPFIIFGIASTYFAAPIITKAYLVQLLAITIYVLFGRYGRVLSRLYGILLGRKTVCIIPHRVKNVKPLQSFISGINIGGYISQRVTYVQTCSRRIGKHIQYVILGLALIFFYLINMMIFPILLPLLFYLFEIIFHDKQL